MKVLFALSAASALIAAIPAASQTYSLGAINSGPVDVTSSYAPGYTLYNFDNGTSPFTGGGVESASAANQYQAPAGDLTPYLSVGPSTFSPATLALSGITQLSFYWGSIDTYNKITFTGLNYSLSGSDLVGTDSSTSRPSREITFYFTPAQAASITGISLSSSTNAFELDNVIFGSAAPEPATWAMMIVGFGMIGAALRRRRSVATRVSYAA